MFERNTGQRAGGPHIVAAQLWLSVADRARATMCDKHVFDATVGDL